MGARMREYSIVWKSERYEVGIVGVWEIDADYALERAILEILELMDEDEENIEIIAVFDGAPLLPSVSVAHRVS